MGALVNIKDNYAVASGNLFQPLIEPHDSILVFSSDRWRKAGCARNIWNICDDNGSGCFVPERAENRFVVCGKLFQADPVPDIVDANANRYDLGVRGNGLIQLPAHDIRSRRAADAKIG